MLRELSVLIYVAIGEGCGLFRVVVPCRDPQETILGPEFNRGVALEGLQRLRLFLRVIAVQEILLLYHPLLNRAAAKERDEHVVGIFESDA
jgi:hypothetical protein